MEYMDVKEAARYNNSSVQSIYRAFLQGKLKYREVPASMFPHLSNKVLLPVVRATTKEWLDEWAKMKHKRTHMYFNGKPIYDEARGVLNSMQAAKFLGISINQFYGYMYDGRIKYTRKGFSKGSPYIFEIEDVKKLGEYISRKESNELEKTA